jgi:hypothetical protein
VKSTQLEIAGSYGAVLIRLCRHSRGRGRHDCFEGVGTFWWRSHVLSGIEILKAVGVALEVWVYLKAPTCLKNPSGHY